MNWINCLKRFDHLTAINLPQLTYKTLQKRELSNQYKNFMHFIERSKISRIYLDWYKPQLIEILIAIFKFDHIKHVKVMLNETIFPLGLVSKNFYSAHLKLIPYFYQLIFNDQLIKDKIICSEESIELQDITPDTNSKFENLLCSNTDLIQTTQQFIQRL